MPIQTEDELRYVRNQIKKYQYYGESILSAEYVKIYSKNGKGKERLLVVGKHRLYTFRKAKMKRDLVTDNHWYDLLEVVYTKKEITLRFRKSKQLLSELIISSPSLPVILQSIFHTYHRLTLGYDERLCCKFTFPSDFSPPASTESQEETIAGGICEAYAAQCNYFQSFFCQDAVRLFEAIYRNKSYDLDLSKCPLVEDPKVMLPLVGALRHNTYFLSLNLKHCQTNQQILLMIANVLKFNSTLTKLEFANLPSASSIGHSLAENKHHAIQVIDINHSKISSKGMEAIAEALTIFPHALQCLRLTHCHLTPTSISMLFSSFVNHYGMSLSIKQLDLSHNRLESKGSVLLGSWMMAVREDSLLEHLYVQNTALSFVEIGRALVHYANLKTVDFSRNKLDEASSRLLTLWIESNRTLEAIDLSGCSLSGDLAGKLLSVLLSNPFLSQLRIHLDRNDFKKEGASQCLVEALKRGSTTLSLPTVSSDPSSSTIDVSSTLSSATLHSLHTLTLSRNKFKATAFISILDALQHHVGLHTLVLDHSFKKSSRKMINEAAAGALALLVNQNSNIKALSISGDFNDLVLPFIGKMDAECGLEELDISQNGLKDIGASAVAHALRNNKHLRYLMLDGNSFTYTGWQCILQSFGKNKNLEKIPFPWLDYQPYLSAKPTYKLHLMRKTLSQIQKMCSVNVSQKKMICSPPPFSLTSKRSVRVDFDAPSSVLPLVEVPDDIEVENELFAFGEDSSDGETEMELLHLKNRHSTILTGNSSVPLDCGRPEEEFGFNSSEEGTDPFLSPPSLPPRGEDTESYDSDTFAPPLPPRDESTESDQEENQKPSSSLLPPAPPPSSIPKRPTSNPPSHLLHHGNHMSSVDAESASVPIPPIPSLSIPPVPSIPPVTSNIPVPPEIPVVEARATSSLVPTPENLSTGKVNLKKRETKQHKSMPSSSGDRLKAVRNGHASLAPDTTSDCTSISDILSRVMGSRREAIAEEEDSFEEYSSEEDSW